MQGGVLHNRILPGEYGAGLEQVCSPTAALLACLHAACKLASQWLAACLPPLLRQVLAFDVEDLQATLVRCLERGATMDGAIQHSTHGKARTHCSDCIL